MTNKHLNKVSGNIVLNNYFVLAEILMGEGRLPVMKGDNEMKHLSDEGIAGTQITAWQTAVSCRLLSECTQEMVK